MKALLYSCALFCTLNTVVTAAEQRNLEKEIDNLMGRLATAEERIARLEQKLGMSAPVPTPSPMPIQAAPPLPPVMAPQPGMPPAGPMQPRPGAPF